MIEYSSSSFSEVVVRIVPAREFESRQFLNETNSASETTKRSYDALIYTELNIPGITRQTSFPPGQPEFIAALPFAGSERITVRWSSYQEYLADFVEGEKAAVLMRERLFEALPPGLNALFSQPLPTDKTVRVWLHGETPELDDLPWELIADSFNESIGRLLLVRGLPLETRAPIVPVGARLRLALIHQPQFTPIWLLDALRELPPDIEVIKMTEPPLKALERVAVEGYELVHLVADGTVSLAYEGILYFHGLQAEDSSQFQSYRNSAAPEITPSELSTVLRNSRASVICLTEQEYSMPDMIDIGGRKVLSVYRAFAYLGGSRLSLPSIVAPLGPLKSEQAKQFWKSFYENLAESFNLSQAVSRARTNPNYLLPAALFLRHFQNVLFRRETTERPSPEVDPVHLGASLQLSNELAEKLKSFGDTYGELSENVNKFIESEEVRQASISAELEPWLSDEEESR